MEAATPPDTPPARRARWLLTLRRLHAWIGLGGSAFGLLFGLTGFLMNHRSVLKIEAGTINETRLAVELAEPLPANPEALGRLLALRFGVPESRVKARLQAPRNGRLGSAPVRAAEQWIVQFQGHRRFAQAAYVPGNRTVEVEQRDASPLQLLKRLHKNDGGSLAWTLLTDAVAGGLVFMTLSGMLLWTRLDGTRLTALGLALGGLAAGLLAAAAGW